MKSHEKNYAFIDAQNLYLAIKSQGWKLDYKKLLTFMHDKYNVTKAFMFIGYITNNEKLYSYLNNCGYELIFKPTIRLGKTGRIKGNVDAELVLHTLIRYRSFHKAIIVSGDGDFHCLVEYLEKKDKLKRLLIPNKENFSQLLWQFIKKCDFVSEVRPKIELKKIGGVA